MKPPFPGRDQRGIALPLALIALVVLSSLVVAFGLLAQSEPVIAANHMRVAMARSLAESGVEHAIWALSNSGVSGLTAPATSATAASPYDGGTFFSLGAGGGFTLTITGSSATLVTLESVGWYPDNTSTASNRAHRKIAVSLEKLPDMGDAPCALCVNGSLTVTGNASIDARGSNGSACGNKVGASSAGSTAITGSADVYGGEGGSTANTANVAGVDYVENATDFNTFTLTDDQLATVKALAKAQGTYYSGTVTFNASNQLPASGIVFVDTVDGGAVTASTADANLADVTLTGNARPSGSPFTGWLIVNGDMSISGGFNGVTGMVYVVNHLTTTGFGNDSISGLVVAHEKRGDAGAGFSAGNTRISYSCDAARGGGQVPTGWFLKTGTYREVAGD